MGKIKIGLIILGLVGLVVAGLVMAKNDSENGKAEFVSGQIIAKFKGDVEPFKIIRVQGGKEMEKVKEYQKRVDVVYVEPDYYVFALGSNDTAYGNQWPLNNGGQTIYKGSGNPDNPIDPTKPVGSGTSDADVDWEEAWNNFSATIFVPTIIAIVDSGVDKNHPDLVHKLTPGYDFVQNDNEPNDVYGHGTHVSGIAAADTDNSAGIAGVAFPDSIKVMPIRVLDDNGMGTVSNVAKGIRYAVDQGAKVINLSLGSKSPSKTLEAAVNYAWGKGVVIAAAAGNDGNRVKYYPASYSKVISVAATDYNDKRASFSNYNNGVDVSAPGVNVFSAFPSYPFTIGTNYGRAQYYDVGSGTSMSVPQVVGLAGLLFAQNPNRTNIEVRNIIEATVDDLGVGGRDDYFGYGRINVFDALKGVKQ